MLGGQSANTEINEISDACLAYLTADPEELVRFMQHTGLDAGDLRSVVGTESLAHGMIDYFAQNEPALLAMCANAGFSAERFMRIYYRLNGDGA